MSDNKKRGDNAASAKSGSKASSIFDLLNQLCGITKKLKEETRGIEEFAEILDHQRKLTSDLQAKEDEVCELRKEKSVLWREFEAKHAEHRALLAPLKSKEAELSLTQSKLKESEAEVARLKTENRRLQQMSTKQTKFAKECAEAKEASESKLRVLEVRHADVERRYDSLKGFLRQDTLENWDLDELEDALVEFAERFHETLFASLQSLDRDFVGIPSPDNIPIASLLLTTGKSARLLRSAAVEWTVSKAMVEYIFVDVYSSKPRGWTTALSTVLKECRDPDREALIRCQLLADNDTDDNTRDRVVQNALDSVAAALGQTLPAGSPRDGFTHTLEMLFREAMALWEPLQRSKRRASADFVLERRYLDRGEDYYGEYGASKASHPGSSTPRLPLFPQISVGDTILLPAKALWSDQEAVAAAEAELERERQD
ncbi:hypothetical protein B0T16DRAFT_460109 [Cercophora newfieldiana]|uniref:Uncharacterized protein n=1 Tax=Cercophora newfieldiana TaxID=92897 RepID=A0AA39Y111_9PEZI|nr:hypothetical protein B0T16DRAFT_460109 [Cercophora newfieldiana]